MGFWLSIGIQIHTVPQPGIKEHIEHVGDCGWHYALYVVAKQVIIGCQGEKICRAEYQYQAVEPKYFRFQYFPVRVIEHVAEQQQRQQEQEQVGYYNDIGWKDVQWLVRYGIGY